MSSFTLFLFCKVIMLIIIIIIIILKMRDLDFKGVSEKYMKTDNKQNSKYGSVNFQFTNNFCVGVQQTWSPSSSVVPGNFRIFIHSFNVTLYRFWGWKTSMQTNLTSSKHADKKPQIVLRSTYLNHTHTREDTNQSQSTHHHDHILAAIILQLP